MRLEDKILQLVQSNYGYHAMIFRRCSCSCNEHGFFDRVENSNGPVTSCNFPSVNAIIKMVERGEVETFRMALPHLKKAYKYYKEYLKLVNIYRKNGGETTERHTSRCCGTFSDMFNNGRLVVPNVYIRTSRINTDYRMYNPYVGLFISRLIRDGEKRCLKHPRNREV